jgi:hypothetical protein
MFVKIRVLLWTEAVWACIVFARDAEIFH